MDRSGMLWIGTIVIVLVFLDLLFVELRRAFREAKRLVTRLEGYADLPLFTQLAKSERDVARIAQALDAVPPLVERARRAVATVRSGGRPRGR